MQLEIIAIILSTIGVILAALSIITTGYWMSKAIRAIHADIKASQEKIERKLQKKEY
jgi:hypothetical protein